MWFILLLYRAGVLDWVMLGNVFLKNPLKGLFSTFYANLVFRIFITQYYPSIPRTFPYSLYRMPTLNLPKLIDILQEHSDRLFSIWSECKNNDLCEEIERQRLKIFKIIQSLEAVNTSFKDATAKHR